MRWPHGDAELQALGGMLAPIVFRAPGRPDFSPLHVAPWADEPDADRWPGAHEKTPGRPKFSHPPRGADDARRRPGGALMRLRGEWPCVPFGRCDRPANLPPGWQPRAPGDSWGHGYASHHRWQWLDLAEPHALGLQIDLPIDQDVRRLTRTVRAAPDAPALDIELQIHVRRPCTLPVALHPTLSLGAGRVRLTLAHDGPGLTYPVPAEPGRSRAAADTGFYSLADVPLAAGGTGDFAVYPQPSDSEELMQLMNLRGPVTADYVDAGWALTLDWDHALLPDLMLWVSHGGRLHPPWNGRHFALGLEPVNATFDLGRVARAPRDHPLAARCGLELRPDSPCVIRSRLSARPSEAST